MAEYIEKQAFLEHMKGTSRYFAVKFDVESFPAADVAPVRHGEWEFLGPNRLVKGCMCGTCSACKVRSKYIVNTELCPNCGAKMDLEAPPHV